MNSNSNDLQLLNLADASLILQVSKRTLLRMIQRKEVPSFKVGGQWRIRESVLRQWIQSREPTVETGMSSGGN